MKLNWIQFNKIFWLETHTNPMIVSQKVQYDCKTKWNRLPSSKVSFIENNSNKLKNSQIHSKTLTIKATTQQKNFLFKVNNRNNRKRCEICSKLTVKTLETDIIISITFFVTVSYFRIILRFPYFLAGIYQLKVKSKKH